VRSAVLMTVIINSINSFSFNCVWYAWIAFMKIHMQLTSCVYPAVTGTLNDVLYIRKCGKSAACAAGAHTTDRANIWY
jgi:hypothetical protein